MGPTPGYGPVEQWVWSSYSFGHTYTVNVTQRKRLHVIMFQIVVSVTQPMKKQCSLISEQTEAWRSENDSLANAQYRKNKGQERQVIRGPSTGRAQMLCFRLLGNIGWCISAKALMLLRARGLWL